MKTHVLKTWPEFFMVVKSRDKTFEVRKNDRDYQPGDALILLEYLPDEARYTGQELRATVAYLMDGGKMGVEAGYCVLGLSNVYEMAPKQTTR